MAQIEQDIAGGRPRARALSRRRRPQRRRHAQAAIRYSVPAYDGAGVKGDAPDVQSSIPAIYTNGHLWRCREKGGGEMEPEPYPDQLLNVLRQMRARVIEAEDVEAIKHELRSMLIGALGTSYQWAATMRPQELPPGAGFDELAEYARQYADALGRQIELVEALRAIDPDFLVEAIDNAIRVVERLA